MERNLTLPRENNLHAVFNRPVTLLRRPFEALADYYGDVLRRPVSLRQTLHLLHAQLATVAAVLPIDGPLVLRMACMAWAVHALLACKRALGKRR